MPRLRAFPLYPPSYGEKLSAAVDSPVVIKMPRDRMAENLRTNLYNYRTAMKIAAEEDSSLLPELARLAPVKIHRYKSALIIYNEAGPTFLSGTSGAL